MPGKKRGREKRVVFDLDAGVEGSGKRLRPDLVVLPNCRDPGSNGSLGPLSKGSHLVYDLLEGSESALCDPNMTCPCPPETPCRSGKGDSADCKAAEGASDRCPSGTDDCRVRMPYLRFDPTLGQYCCGRDTMAPAAVRGFICDHKKRLHATMKELADELAGITVPAGGPPGEAGEGGGGAVDAQEAERQHQQAASVRRRLDALQAALATLGRLEDQYPEEGSMCSIMGGRKRQTGRHGRVRRGWRGRHRTKRMRSNRSRARVRKRRRRTRRS